MPKYCYINGTNIGVSCAIYKIRQKVMKILKTSISNSPPRQSVLSINLDTSAIIKQDIKRVALEDAHNLNTQRHNHALLEKLNLMFKNVKEEEETQLKENTTCNLFYNYISNACQNYSCSYRAKISPYCTNCLLKENQIAFSVCDGSITYYLAAQPEIAFNSEKDINKLLSYFSHNSMATMPVFQSYPPNTDQLKSIFSRHRELVSLNLKIPDIKRFANFINYALPLNLIQYQIAKRLLLLYHTADAIISQDDSAKQIAQLQNEYDSILCNKFHISTEKQNFINEQLNQSIAFINYKIESKYTPTTFANLTRILLTISNGNPNTVKQLAIMLAKIFIGRSYLEYLDEDSNNLTIVITNNPIYIKKFFSDIFLYNPMLDKETNFQHRYQKKEIDSFYHFTDYSAAYLSDEKNIGELIKDKLLGNIINIDTTHTSAGSKFKDLIDGRTITYTDAYFGQLRYRSNAHYIRINQDINQNGLGSYNITYDTIICNGNLSNALYEPLDDYELFFLVTGFVNYGIDLLSEETIKPATPQITPLELVNEFINKFCSDTTNTIPQPPETSEIKDDKERLSIAKELGITKLPFTHVDTLVEYFIKWCKIAHENITHYDENVIKDTFVNKYPNIFYLKKKAMIPSGRPKDARGIYGLNFEHQKFINFTNTDKLPTQPDNSSPEEFVSFFRNILNLYFLIDKD
jgi:hypothetical protein